MTRIYVNYRREDVPMDARRIRDGLGAYFGQSEVLMETDGLLAGQRADHDPVRSLEGCDALVVVIGSRWLELMRAHAANGRRDQEREQIAAALRRGMPIYAVRVSREGSPPPMLRGDDLPDDIRGLGLLPGRVVAIERFATDMTALAESIKTSRQAAIGVVRAQEIPAGDKAPGNSTFKLWLWSAAAAASAALVANIGVWLTGPAASPSSPRPPGLIKKAFDSSYSTVENRIRRAMAAAAAAGRRAEEARRCQASLIAVTDSGLIVFDTASAELDRRSHQTLDQLARIIRDCPDFVVEVEGHTDSVGDPAANQRLSERRATAVRDYLIQSGVPRASLAAVGYGEERPVAPNDSPANMARNRRIEFNVTTR